MWGNERAREDVWRGAERCVCERRERGRLSTSGKATV